MRIRLATLSLLLVAGPVAPAPARPPVRPLAGRIVVSPAAVALAGPGEHQRLQITRELPGGVRADVSHQAVLQPVGSVCTVEAGGVRGVRAGRGRLRVRVGTASMEVPVSVGAREAANPSFLRDVLPMLGRSGCSQAACHAKQGGKGGFQLSVLAFDPEADYAAVLRGGGGRRINRADPGRSLILLKASMTVPHAGGLRMRTGSAEYALLADWISRGAPFAHSADPTLARIEVEPAARVLRPTDRQLLRVTAIYADGSRRDVSELAEYRTNEENVARVDERGLVLPTGTAGEAALMARFMGQVSTARVMVPHPAQKLSSAAVPAPAHNFIDDAVHRKLKRLNLAPSPPADDAVFLRRVYLDLIGTLPTVAEARSFLEECRREREGAPAARAARAALVERLLARPEYADYWATRWVNILLVDRDPLFPKGAFAYDRWVREAFRGNMRYDEFARQLLTASGYTYRDGPSNFYRSLASAEERAKAVAQLFLGVRLDCAQCHHHPFERWGQDDFYSFSAYFSRVGRKGASEFEQIVYPTESGDVKHPKSGATMPPRPLGAEPPESTDADDRRLALARWVTAPGNPYFSRTIVNRIWGLMLGTGIVEPVDDFRSTNPPSNDELLDALATDFERSGYDLKHLLKTITASATYQRSSDAVGNNGRDTRNYARYYPRRLVAEVLLDAVGEFTGVMETYPGHPASTRAIQMWDNKLPVEFLEVFGKPSRLSVCECDRPADGSVPQVLHLMNSPAVQNRLSAEKGRVAALDAPGKTDEAIVEELYFAGYSRPPTVREMEAGRQALHRAKSRRLGIEDLAWALLNSAEFVFNH